MKTAFFLQNNHVTFNTAPVAEYARQKGIEIIDRSSPLSVMDCGVDWSQYDLIVPYGSVQFNRLISDSPLSKFLNYNESDFHTDEWVKEYGAVALNGKGFITFVCYLEIDRRWALNESKHIRPNSYDKAFIAKVFTKDEWTEQAKTLDPYLTVFVSPIQEIEAEYRCWCVHGKIVEVSQYVKDGVFSKERISADSFVGGFAQALVDTYKPEDTVVIDIAKTKDGLKFLEFNSFHASGWYAADIGNIFDKYLEEFI